MQRRPGRRIVDGDGGALFEGQRIGQYHGIVRRYVDDFGVATESRAGQDSFADAGGIDAIPDGLDRPGDFVADHRRKFRRVRVHAHAGKVVGEVHPRGAYRNPQLARARRRRVGPLLDLQDGWIAMLGDDDCAHRVPSSGRERDQSIVAHAGNVAATFLLVHFAWEQLTAHVHRCRLPFCDVTIGLVQGRSGALLVDTGTTLVEAAAIDADVRRIAGRPITHVVLTHKHFDHVLGSSVFGEADVYCAPEVVEYLASATDRLRDDALSYGANPAEIDRAIAVLRPPQHGIYDAVIDLGDRTVTIAHLGRGHTTSDLVVVVPVTDYADHKDDRVVVFTGDLVEESADPAIDADSDVAA